MSVRASVLLGALQMVGALTSAHALTIEELIAKLQSAGYSRIRESPSGKIKSFRAVKNGKEVSVVVDTTGHIKELQ